MNIKERRIFEVEVDDMTVEQLEDIINNFKYGTPKIYAAGIPIDFPEEVVDETPVMSDDLVDTSNQYNIISHIDPVMNSIISSTASLSVFFMNAPIGLTVRGSTIEATDKLIEVSEAILDSEYGTITNHILDVVTESLSNEDINAIYLYSYQLLSMESEDGDRHAIKIRYALI